MGINIDLYWRRRKISNVPVHIWLPDAMEGPTPVSALIHAATMVVAGVYLVARLFPLFSLTHAALSIVTFVGIVSAFLAAIIACTQTDIKECLLIPPCRRSVT
jgi:NADH-quinone oxidoreductase subunit L